ncbi:MAG TPA: DNA repair protein RecO [Candidatus Methylomirabilis sp.]|nr:DNA repair protein RecO [Candidatus Methylomirabilis sp.]
MALYKTQALVIGRRGLGESDRLVEFYTRDFGKLRGVARSARRPRSRFGSALEPFTLGELIFFDTGRSELVRVDHFDILHPFRALHEALDRLGRAAWTVECVARLSADRDPHPALFRFLVRALKALESSPRPAWVAACFAVRAVDLLGYRPRTDRCVVCGQLWPFPQVALDVAAGGLVCGRCRPGPDAMPLSAATLAAFRRLRELRWEESLRLALAPAQEGDVSRIIEGVMARLAGQIPRSSRFLAQMERPLSRVAEPAPTRRRP